MRWAWKLCPDDDNANRRWAPHKPAVVRGLLHGLAASVLARTVLRAACACSRVPTRIRRCTARGRPARDMLNPLASAVRATRARHAAARRSAPIMEGRNLMINVCNS
eukprot:6181638-Pleurochrysis_carterae.AAC.4